MSATAYEFERISTQVRLVGAGTDGLGEDVSGFREDGTARHETRPSLPLEGEWTQRASATTSPRSSCGRSLRRGRIASDVLEEGLGGRLVWAGLEVQWLLASSADQ